MKSRYIIPGSIIMIILLLMGHSCKKEEAPVRAVAAFVIGNVVCEHPGEPARQVRHKDELHKDDTIKTGHQSILVVQLGRESLIKIEADTTVRLSSMMEQGTTKFELAQGAMFNRVKNLNKDFRYLVQTKTSIAAVRGTEFSVSSGDGTSTVAVNDGSVKVQGITKKNEIAGERTIGKGSAAVVKDAIAIRPLSDKEKNDFNRFQKIAAVKDIENTGEPELRKMEDEFFQEDNKPVGKMQVESLSGKDKPDGDDPAKSALVWTGKQVYRQSDEIIVHYKNLPEYRNCWIDISKASDAEGRYQSYNWTYSAKNGQMTFSHLNLQPGMYEARIHFSKSNAVSKRYRFQVR